MPSRSPERRRLTPETAALYGVTESALYRALRGYARPRALRRADYLGLPLAKLPEHQLDEIDTLLTRTLQKQEVIEYVRAQISPTLQRFPRCCMRS